MEFFEVVKTRRSCRKYTDKLVPELVMRNALEAAVLAPNSSNLQTWQFYWVRSSENKKKLVEACLSQSAARTAQELVVVVANRKLWRAHNRLIIDHLKKEKVDSRVLLYYEKLVPISNSLSLLAPFKWLALHLVGLFRPMVRTTFWPWDQDEVPVKSAALGAENFMLAIRAQGFDSCPMEGMDEVRVKRLLKLPCAARVVMVISVGERQPSGIWGQQFRVPNEMVIKEI